MSAVGQDLSTAPPDGVLPADRCLCTKVHIRSGAKVLALVDQAAAIVVLVAVIWEYAELKYIRPSDRHPTPILDGVFATTLLTCIYVVAAATLLLVDTISRVRTRFRCLIEAYVLRRLVSALCLPAGVLISVIGLISDDANGSQNYYKDAFVRRCAYTLAAEIFDPHEIRLDPRRYTDVILGTVLTVCILSLPFDLWALLVTYKYYRYASNRHGSRRFLDPVRGDDINGITDEVSEMQDKDKAFVPVAEAEITNEITVSETEFLDGMDVSLLTRSM